MHSDDHDSSRRKLIQGAAATFAAGMVLPGFAQAADADATPQAAPAPLRDPKALHPQPPFDKQSQPWPGLARDMQPPPDHGEKSYRGSNRLAGRKALITGGDSGIGRAAAIAFAREGADVAIGYLPDEEPDAQAVVALIRDAGRKAVALPGDIRDEAFCRSMVQKAVEELGGLDVLVNNAAVPHMPAGASIINTSSVTTYDPPANLLDYSLTKAAITNFSKGLAKQLIDKGIRVNAVAPGPFWTPLQVSGGQTMENLQRFGGDTPMSRPGQPAEIAPLYVLLASTEASYVTGQVFGASGGNGQP
ncbi:SDR family oxidoreductase [Stutzerimonas stutzeri]|uniref:SDR family oxidoreductase n=1 Tax=Stutzerimonas stutzeri TaxID=316 RepID=UPI002446C80E|nr:SDR family oxidoreductase [Stutzerimonas stutzeri]MDH0157581.1 SDR family oxidoreductase [Stutzerimonas stutzeri]